MSRHLQQHVWHESAYTLENVKSGRWHLGSCGRFSAADGFWHQIMLVSKQKQTFFLQRLHFQFAVKRRQVRQPTHARLNAEGWDALVDSSCLLMWVLEEMSRARDPDGLPVFPPDVIRMAMQKMLEGSLTSQFHLYFLN